MHHTLSSSRAGTIAQLVADVPSGLGLVPLHPMKKSGDLTNRLKNVAFT
jgi:hypothetical protein